jgi:hypothetical protein
VFNSSSRCLEREEGCVEMKCKQCDYLKREFTALQIFNRVLEAAFKNIEGGISGRNEEGKF